jgi:8-oxo-dGTP diphosphatase
VVACCNVIVDVHGRYLLVQETKASARQRFNFPAGKLEIGETLTEAAAREAREEAGVDVDVVDLIGIYQCPRTSEGSAVVNFVFSSVITGGSPTSSEAHPVARFFSHEEIESMAAEGLLRGTHIILSIADHRAGRRLPRDAVVEVPPSPRFK